MIVDPNNGLLNDPIFDKWLIDGLTTNTVTTVVVGNDYTSQFLKLNLDITKVIWNDNAVIVFWSDKTKTVVKKMESDNDDIYAAVAQALAKKIYGGTGNFHTKVDKVFQDHRTGIATSAAMRALITSSFGKFFNGIWNISHRDSISTENKGL